MQKLLRAISLILHPVWIFPLLLIIAVPWNNILAPSAVMLLSFVIPFSYFAQLYKSKKISDFDVSKHKERQQLYSVALLGLLLSLAYLYFFSTMEIFWAFLRLLGIALTLVAFNIKIKVSVHAALTTLLCLTLFLDYDFTAFIFLLIPLVALSRLKLKRHTVKELILGTLIPALYFSPELFLLF